MLALFWAPLGMNFGMGFNMGILVWGLTRFSNKRNRLFRENSLHVNSLRRLKNLRQLEEHKMDSFCFQDSCCRKATRQKDTTLKFEN